MTSLRRMQSNQGDLVTDAAPVTPQNVMQSMNFSDVSWDAEPGRRNSVNNSSPPVQIPANTQETQTRGGGRRPQNLGGKESMDELSRSSMNDVEKNLIKSEEKIKGLSLSLESEADSSYSSMELSSSMPSTSWEEEIKQYEKFMPLPIKIGYFDALILYAEEDRDQAEKFRQHLIQDIDIGVYGPVTAMLYDCPDLTTLSQSQISHLALAVDRSTYVFMYLTKHFIEDKWMEFSSESCLMTAIYDEEKRWCVVPVYTEKRNKCTFRIPMGLNSLKGINYYSKDEFYKRGVARLISDKVQQRITLNENHKTKQKQWLEKFKREQMELRERQKRVAHIEEAKTAQMMQWLKDETERLIQSGIISGLQHSFSDNQLSTPNHSLPHIPSISSMKDVHSQNPNVQAYFQSLCRQNRQALHAYTAEQISVIQNVYGTQPPVQTPTSDPRSWLPAHGPQEHLSNSSQTVSSVPQRDNAASTYHASQSDVVLFPIQTEQGFQRVKIPKALSDRIESCSLEDKNNYVKTYLDQVEGTSTELASKSSISQYQQILTKEQMLQSYSSPNQPGIQSINSVHPSDLQHGGPRGQAPPLAMSMNDQGHQPFSRPPQNIPGNQLNSVGPQSLQGNQLNPGGPQYAPGNQPDFGALLSHSSAGQSLELAGSYHEAVYNSADITQNYGGNLPNSGLFNGLEEDCGSFKSDQGSKVPDMFTPSDKGKLLHSTDKGRQPKYEDESDEKLAEIKKKKPTKSKQEKHVHYTINVYSANSVQVGNQNMVQSGGDVEPDLGHSSEDDTENPPIEITQQTQKKLKSLDPENTTHILKKDPVESDDSDEGTRGETGEQQQTTQGSYNMDAALSTIGSQPANNSHMESPESKITRPKTILEDEKLTSSSDLVQTSQKQAFQKIGGKIGRPSSPSDSTDKLSTTNQLPEGLEQLINSNLERSATFEKCLKDKVIVDQKISDKESCDEYEKNTGGELKRQDSKLKSETNPVVAVIAPMRPKIPSESGEYTEVKQIVSIEETGVKSVAPVTIQTGTRAMNTNDIPAQLLTKTATHSATNQNSTSTDTTVNYTSEGASVNTADEPREVFSRQRLTNATELFYPNRFAFSQVPYRTDASTTSGHQGDSSESFMPGTGPFTGSGRSEEDQIEYDMCDSDSFEGTDSGGNSVKHSNPKPRIKGDKNCVIS